MKIKVYNFVVAAGKGNRFGSEIPKQFCLLKGKPVLVHTIERIKSIFSELDTSSVKTSYDADTILVLSKGHIELGQGSIPTVPVVDSLRQIDASTGKSAPIDRDFIRAVQTPQAFHAARLIEAYRLPYKPTFTDDASVMAEAGFDNIRLSEGNPHNIKITLPTDLEIASIYL